MTADLIVVESLVRLYDCPEDDMLCHVLAVIGRGAPVVTLSTWNLAARDPNKVAPTSVIRHRPLAIQKRVTFVVDLKFQTREGGVMHVLEARVGLADSRWKLRKTDTINMAQESKKTTSKHEFVYLQNIGVLREWLKKKTLTENIRGQRVWTLQERLL